MEKGGVQTENGNDMIEGKADGTARSSMEEDKNRDKEGKATELNAVCDTKKKKKKKTLSIFRKSKSKLKPTSSTATAVKDKSEEKSKRDISKEKSKELISPEKSTGKKKDAKKEKSKGKKGKLEEKEKGEEKAIVDKKENGKEKEKEEVKEKEDEITQDNFPQTSMEIPQTVKEKEDVKEKEEVKEKEDEITPDNFPQTSIEFPQTVLQHPEEPTELGADNTKVDSEQLEVAPLQVAEISDINLASSEHTSSKQHSRQYEPKVEIAGRIMIYATGGSPECQSARKIIEDLGLPYHYILFENYKANVRSGVAKRILRAEKHRKTNLYLPYIFFNDTFIGSLQDLQKLTKNEEEWAIMLDYLQNIVPTEHTPNVPPRNMLVKKHITDDQNTTKNVIEADTVNVGIKETEASVSTDEAEDDENLMDMSEMWDIVDNTDDELAELVHELKVNSGIIQDHKTTFKMRTHHMTFTGADFVNWLVESRTITRHTAIAIGQSLLDKGYGLVAHAGYLPHSSKPEFKDSSTALYRIVEHGLSHALNEISVTRSDDRGALATTSSSEASLKASNFASALSTIIEKLFAKHLVGERDMLDYEEIYISKNFEAFRKFTKELQNINLNELVGDTELRIAFFINLYNAMNIHSLIVNGAPVTSWQRYKFYDKTKYVVGGLTFSLDDIYHGILRGNQRSHFHLFPPFLENDERSKYIVPSTFHIKSNTDDDDNGELLYPLIHFALTQGFKGSPKLSVYKPETLYKDLRNACAEYLTTRMGCTLDISKRTVYISRIFKWYSHDFFSDPKTKCDKILSWVETHLPHEGSSGTRSLLNQLLQFCDTEFVHLKYLPYDYTLNCKPYTALPIDSKMNLVNENTNKEEQVESTIENVKWDETKSHDQDKELVVGEKISDEQSDAGAEPTNAIATKPELSADEILNKVVEPESTYVASADEPEGCPDELQEKNAGPESINTGTVNEPIAVELPLAQNADVNAQDKDMEISKSEQDNGIPTANDDLDLTEGVEENRKIALAVEVVEDTSNDPKQNLPQPPDEQDQEQNQIAHEAMATIPTD